MKNVTTIQSESKAPASNTKLTKLEMEMARTLIQADKNIARLEKMIVQKEKKQLPPDDGLSSMLALVRERKESLLETITDGGSLDRVNDMIKNLKASSKKK